MNLLGLREIGKLTVTKSALSTLIVIIPMIVGFFTYLPFEIELIAVIITSVLNIILVSREFKQPTVDFDGMLELWVNSLWHDNQLHHYRSNIMILDGKWYEKSKSKQLRIKYRYHMAGYVDRDFCIKQNQGCAGRAFTSKKPHWVDLTVPDAHGTYGIDAGEVWDNMKSVLSVPIILKGKALGTLNIDSDLEINKSGLNQEKIYTVTQAYADLIAVLL